MENLYDNILSMEKSRLAPQQMLLESNIQLETNSDISKILAVDGSIDLDEIKEAIKGEVEVNGKAILNVVYVNAEGELNNQTCATPFNYKYKNEVIDGSSKFNFVANLVNSEIEKVSENQIKLITTINIEGVMIKNHEVSYLKDGDKNTFCKKRECPIVSHDKKICEKIEETMTASVKNGVKKILMTNVECLIKEWTPGVNFVSVDLELYAKILYADNQDPSELQTITISKNIKHEIEVGGVDKDSDIDIMPFVAKEGVVVELAENGEDTVISVNLPIMLCLNTYIRNKILTVEDIYSTQNTLEILNDGTNNFENCPPEYLEGKIEGNVVLSDDNPRVDKFICATNVHTLNSNCYVKDGILTLEGIVTANVVYLNDELGEMQSVEIEMPYVIDKKSDLPENVILEPFVCLCDVDVMVKRGREIYFDAKAKAFINVTKNTRYEFVSKVTELGLVPQKDGAIEIYFAKQGETIWDIAKNLKIASEIISQQNPDLVDPLDKDQNIAIYYQRQR